MAPDDPPMSTSQIEPAELFETLDRSLSTSTPAEALEALAKTLSDRSEFRALLDARLLQARLDLGLPLIQGGSLTEIPEPSRSRYEERYVEAIREVGHRLLDAGGDWRGVGLFPRDRRARSGCRRHRRL